MSDDYQSWNADHDFKRFMKLMLVAILCGYGLLYFAVLKKWEPGEQDRVYREEKVPVNGSR